MFLWPCSDGRGGFLWRLSLYCDRKLYQLSSQHTQHQWGCWYKFAQKLKHLGPTSRRSAVGEFGGKLANSAVSPSGRGCRYLGVALVCSREDRNWDHYGTKKLNISILTGGLSFPMCCSLEVSTQTLLIISIIDLFSVANSFCSKTIRVAKTGPRHSYLDGEQHSKFHSVRQETPCRSSGASTPKS